MQKLRIVFALFALAFATTAGAVPFDGSYFVGVDGLSTLASGTYAGLANPNAGRLTFLFGHGDHYHGIGAYSYSGAAASPTVESTNANNTIPELYTNLPPLTLEPGSGPYVGKHVSGLGTATQDLEYGDLDLHSTGVLASSGDPTDAILFNSSGGRWTGALGLQRVGLELVAKSTDLEIGNALGTSLFGAGIGSIEEIGVGDGIDFLPVFFTTSSLPAVHTATFRLVDLGSASGGGAQFGSSGTFNLTFQVVPEPGTALLMGLGLAGLSAVRRPRDED